LVFVDGMDGARRVQDHGRRSACIAQLLAYLPAADQAQALAAGIDDGAWVPALASAADAARYGMPPFFIPTGKWLAARPHFGPNPSDSFWSNFTGARADSRATRFAGPLPRVEPKFTLAAPTTAKNMYRVLRAMQAGKPVLLEGSPGVGKTSLVLALASATGHAIERINLSEQTDIMDLFGSDLPVEGRVGEFAWRDGPLLKAMKLGQWVVLDELNLASQSVLEGLNACLDHRGEVYIPELNRRFQCSSLGFRLFACQNPLHQGGGRKGLPSSFLNRFTLVHVGSLDDADLSAIVLQAYPRVPATLVTSMVEFRRSVHALSGNRPASGNEPNLRDLFRWCELLLAEQEPGRLNPRVYAEAVFGRFRPSASDAKMAAWQALIQQLPVEEEPLPTPTTTAAAQSREPVLLSAAVHRREAEAAQHRLLEPACTLCVSTEAVCLGRVTLRKSMLPRAAASGHTSWAELGAEATILPSMAAPLEQIASAVAMGWMVNVVGAQGSGKTALVKALAALTQNDLTVFNMNSSVDTMELLGGFEQVDLAQERSRLVQSAEEAMLAGTRVLLAAAEVNADARSQRLAALQTLLGHWHGFVQGNGMRSEHPSNEHTPLDLAALRHVQQVLATTCAEAALDPDLATEHAMAHHALTALEEATAAWEGRGSASAVGAFEWRDGPLLRALKEGRWLLVDNVNFCSPAVLDRLNGLLEPGVELILSERGVVDGKVSRAPLLHAEACPSRQGWAAAALGNAPPAPGSGVDCHCATPCEFSALLYHGPALWAPLAGDEVTLAAPGCTCCWWQPC
jgi:midasin